MSKCRVFLPLTPKEAAREFSKHMIAKGYVPEALHPYQDQTGKPVYYRIRLKHPDGEKWIRPMYLDANGQYHLEEPPEFKELPKMLYGLQLLGRYQEAVVYIVEGEWSADKLNNFLSANNANAQYIALTSGSCTSAVGADWNPLAGRRCVLWADNDDAGKGYTRQVAEILVNFGCLIQHIDVDSLQLLEGGDCVDWLSD